MTSGDMTERRSGFHDVRLKYGTVSFRFRYYREGKQTTAVFSTASARDRFADACEAARRAGLPLPPPPRHRTSREGGQRRRRGRSGESPTFGEYYTNTYLPQYGRHLSGHYRKTHDAFWRRNLQHPDYGIAGYRLDDLCSEPDLLQEFMTALEEEGGLQPSTCNVRYWVLKAIIDKAWANRTSLGISAGVHPFATGVIVEPPRGGSALRRAFSPIQFEAIAFEIASDERLTELEILASRLTLRLQQCLGVRPAEARAMRLGVVVEGGAPRARARVLRR